jgi:hypothetical protein
MNRSLAVIGSLVAVWLVLLAGLASYAAFANGRTVHDMGNMMGDMGNTRATWAICEG